jgi:hypothetical protein
MQDEMMLLTSRNKPQETEKIVKGQEIMMEISEEERKLIEKLAPVLEESLRYKLVRSIIDALEEQTYPPEDTLRQDFINSVRRADKEIRESKSKRYTQEEFKREFPMGGG